MSDLLHRLNLTSLSPQLPTLREAARQQQLSYEAFLETALRAELDGRQQRAQERRFRAARLPFPARLERFDFRFQPTVSERLMREHINFLEARLDATLDKNAGSKKIRMNLASFNVPINKKLSVD